MGRNEGRQTSLVSDMHKWLKAEKEMRLLLARIGLLNPLSFSWLQQLEAPSSISIGGMEWWTSCFSCLRGC